MPIVDADLQFRASERMTDFADGGGRMSTNAVVSGVKNNLFPDISDIDRLAGRVYLRKIYGAVLNNDSAPLLSAHAMLDAPPGDSATTAAIFRTGGIGTTRAQAQAALEAWYRIPSGERLGITGDAGQTTARVVRQFGGTAPTPVVGMVLGLSTLAATDVSAGADPTALERKRITSVAFVGVQGGGAQLSVWNVSFDSPLGQSYVLSVPPPGSSEQLDNNRAAIPNVELTEIRTYGVATASGSSSSGATSISVDSTSVKIVPYTSGAYPTTSEGIDPDPFEFSNGQVKMIRPGDTLLVHHTQSESPQSVSNGQTVSIGRTNLQRVRIIGSTGVEHYRATAGQTPIGSGVTVNLTTGSVTFVDVSGLAQPVVIEHRIEQLASCSSAGATSVHISPGLSRTFPAGTRVSSLLMVGDLQGRALDGFAQQAWTGAWSDTVIGGSPVGDFNEAAYPIVVTNAGTVTQRWAVIFTNTTSFRVIGEDLGEIGTGSTTTAFSPLNPATGVPYFTIPALSWGSGWAAGNVYRFNTEGANTPVWALRCVSPSSPGGNDSVTLQLRGYINT